MKLTRLPYSSISLFIIHRDDMYVRLQLPLRLVLPSISCLLFSSFFFSPSIPLHFSHFFFCNETCSVHLFSPIKSAIRERDSVDAAHRTRSVRLYGYESANLELDTLDALAIVRTVLDIISQASTSSGVNLEHGVTFTL